MIDVRVVDDPAAEVADVLLDVGCAGGHIALAGGSTPRRAYGLVAGRDADLSAATMWLGDERIVPPDHEWSNERMVRESLLAAMPEDRRPALVRVETELGVDGAAAAYEDRLREKLGHHPRLDLALLGLGPDAHTASLFPGMPALQEHHRLAVGVPDAGMDPRVPRVTLTFLVLNTAREVVFLVSGADKAEAVVRAFADPADPAAPAAHVRPGAGTLTVILDPAAARGLQT
ncbi:MAG TPA: 6-phosphogluconolactonase [Solirubrobacteraceae bacterium]|nr:6-phosphogluconolactonase [Solirubrobacteraceae bacterium]